MYMVLLTFECVDEIPFKVTIQMKATEQYFPVVLLIMLYMYKVALTFESVDKIVTSFYSNETLLRSSTDQDPRRKDPSDPEDCTRHLLELLLQDYKISNNRKIS